MFLNMRVSQWGYFSVKFFLYLFFDVTDKRTVELDD